MALIVGTKSVPGACNAMLTGAFHLKETFEMELENLASQVKKIKKKKILARLQAYLSSNGIKLSKNV